MIRKAEGGKPGEKFGEWKQLMYLQIKECKRAVDTMKTMQLQQMMNVHVAENVEVIVELQCHDGKKDG